MSNRGGWNPYLAGALTGVLIILSVWLAGKYFGTSTTFVRSVGLIEEMVNPDRVAEMEYFIIEEPKIDWQWMFVLGIFFGSLVSSLTSKSFQFQTAPDMWRKRFGGNPFNRGIVAFMGGIVALFGARLAGGCPSGQGLSGSLQLSVSGLVAMSGFLLGGMVVARLIYGGKK